MTFMFNKYSFISYFIFLLLLPLFHWTQNLYILFELENIYFSLGSSAIPSCKLLYILYTSRC